MPEISSRISCVACCGSFSKTNSTMMLPKLSSELEVIRSTPLMPEMTSSIGSITSRSTTSGDAPGYGIATTTIGASISGNSSVSSCVNATMPKTTRISIPTTVSTGRLMAVSEMNMTVLLRRADGDRRARGDPLGGAAQQCIPFVHAGRNLHPLGTRVAQAEGDVDALGLAVGHAQHPWRCLGV